MDLIDMLRSAREQNASDLILSAGAPPAVRINGQLIMGRGAPLTAEQTKKLLYEILKTAQIARFEKDKELDFSFSLDAAVRVRGNAFWQRSSIGAAFRLITNNIPPFESLGLPAIIEEFAMAPQGLVLVTGPTGHGKSTTQAAMIDLINTRRKTHIITIEDPIEFLHTNKKSIIEQREVGEDTNSFAEALHHVLREAPDVILIGEMRDPESIAAALTAAETGHLVIATLHTNDCVQAVDRLIDVFPGHQQSQVRGQLSMSLLAVLAQRLLAKADGTGRIPAVEILRATPAVSNLIRESMTHQLYAIMETQAKAGMRTMDAALKQLYLQGAVTYDEVKARMRIPAMLDRT
jgi:twitching motility protein PilT